MGRGVGAEDIIKFRKDYVEERSAFQAEVTKIIKDLDYLRDMRDATDIQRRLESEYDKRLAGKVRRLEQGMRRSGWDVIDSTLASSFDVPVAVTGTLGAFGFTLPAAAVGAFGIACAGWSILRKRSNARTEPLKPSAESYLYRVKKDLTPARVVNEIARSSVPYFAYI